jgi:hypothetical protein
LAGGGVAALGFAGLGATTGVVAFGAVVAGGVVAAGDAVSLLNGAAALAPVPRATVPMTIRTTEGQRRVFIDKLLYGGDCGKPTTV